jgi:hypothetical protein
VSEAIFRAMRDRPLEIDLPFSPRACFRSSRVPPRVLLRLYEPLKGKGMKQIERVRRERGLA